MPEFTHPENLERERSPDGFDRVVDEVDEFMNDIVLRQNQRRYDDLLYEAEDDVIDLLRGITEAKLDVEEAKSIASEHLGVNRRHGKDESAEELYYVIEELEDAINNIWDLLDGAHVQIESTGDEIIEEASKWKVHADRRSREIDEIKNFTEKLASSLDRVKDRNNYLIEIYTEIYDVYENLKQENKSLETQLESASLIE
jgi:chemotaxis regulatin CheY-phosphate phosphatase CheZ